MGIDPYLIAPTLILSMAQRLVSKLCPGGGKPIPVEDSIKLMIDKQFEDLPLEFKKQIIFNKEVYGIQPTDDCLNGTSGRMAVIEVLEMDIIMPSMDGVELLATIRKEKLSPDSVVIMLTNESSPEKIEKAKKLGIKGYIVKATRIPTEVVEEAVKIANLKTKN